MKISVKMHTWEKILGWLLLVLHVLALPILIELFCVLLSIDLDNGMFNIVFFVLSFLLTVAFFGRFLWKNFQNFKKWWSIARPNKALLFFQWLTSTIPAVLNVVSAKTFSLVDPILVCFSHVKFLLYNFIIYTFI